MKLAVLLIVIWAYGAVSSQIVPADKCEHLAAQINAEENVDGRSQHANCYYYESKGEQP